VVVKKYLFVLFTSGLFFSACQSSKQPIASPEPQATMSSTMPSSAPTNSATSELTIESPQPNQEVSSPLTVKGKLPGTWFFEGQIYAELIAEDGEVLAGAPLYAEGEWMTEDDVPFSGELIFNNVKNVSTATLVIRNDNPSGLPENQKKAEIPVQF
jgi:hypothetical protein